jgi:hypothetical protein
MFTTALLKFQHEIGAAVLFIIAMGLFTMAMIYLAREVRLSHKGSFSQRGGSSKKDGFSTKEKHFPFARRPSPPLP